MAALCLTTASQIEAAAELAQREHGRLRASLPFLPARDPAHYAAKLEWLAEHGEVVGVFDSGRLGAFLGGFVVADFRHAGPGAFCPDWSHGADADGSRATARYRQLYRELARRWRSSGARIHAAAAYATDTAALEALVSTGFGRIVEDAARPLAELAAALDREPDGGVRRAGKGDAETLAALEVGLAAHLEGSPVFLPHPRGRTAAAWTAWLAEPDARAYLVQERGEALGYIKAQEPQIDVSDAVHGPTTLAINGLFVRPAARGRGLARSLLAALVREAAAAGKTIASVDCETTNLEAWDFWTHWFAPVAYGHERRT